MKKILKYLTMLCLTVFVGIMFNSVDAKAARANGPTSLEVNEYSNYPCFYVHTDNNWTVTVDPGSEFITPLNPTGTKGDAIIVLRIDSNPTPYTRYGYVRVNDGRGEVSIYIIQKGKPVKPDGKIKIYSVGPTNGVDWMGFTIFYEFCTDSKVTVKYNGKEIKSIVYGNGDYGKLYYGYIYVDINNDFWSKWHTVEIIVDGKNIVGGNYHRYDFEQPRDPSWDDFFR